jgi:hypothetical protein
MFPTVRLVAACLLLMPTYLPAQRPPQPGQLTVTSTPPGADITVDGHRMKKTPFTFFVSPDVVHRVILTDSNLPKCGGPKPKQVSVPSGSAISINCTKDGWDTKPPSN